jgi:hypothetical protein
MILRLFRQIDPNEKKNLHPKSTSWSAWGGQKNHLTLLSLLMCVAKQNTWLKGAFSQ